MNGKNRNTNRRNTQNTPVKNNKNNKNNKTNKTSGNNKANKTARTTRVSRDDNNRQNTRQNTRTPKINKDIKKSNTRTKSVKKSNSTVNSKASNKAPKKNINKTSNRNTDKQQSNDKVVSIQPYLEEKRTSNERYKRVTRPSKRSINNVNKVKKQRRFQLLSGIFTIIIFVFITIYITVSTIKVIDNKPIDYETLAFGTLEKQSQVNGILVRDEVVYTAGRSGVISYSVSQSEKITKNQFVAEIKDTLETQQTELELQEINSQILALQEKRDELSIFAKDVERLETQVQGIIEKSIYDLTTGNMANLYDTKEVVDKNLTSRNQMLLSESTSSLENLSSQKFEMEQQISANTQAIYSNEAGILSYQVDGFEDILTLDNLATLTKEQTLATPQNTTEFRLDVLENEAVFKVVVDNTLYIASYIENDSISMWHENETRTIYINDSGASYPLEINIELLVKGTYETYVLMSTNKNMINFIDNRNVTFQINEPKEGFKVALSAIVQENLIKIPNEYLSYDGVVLKKTDLGNIEVPIDMAGEDEYFKFANINPEILDIGDIIISHDTGKEYQINEIQVVKGIYIVNAGVSSLREINTEGSVQDDQFIILEPSKNTNIKLYDRYSKFA